MSGQAVRRQTDGNRNAEVGDQKPQCYCFLIYETTVCLLCPVFALILNAGIYDRVVTRNRLISVEAIFPSKEIPFKATEITRKKIGLEF